MKEEVENWWSSDREVQETGASSSSAPFPEIARRIFSSLAPIINNSIEFDSNNEHYWDNVSKFIKQLTEKDTTPISNFSDFLNIIFENRNLVKPLLPEHYIVYIEKFSTKPLSKFLLIDFPHVIESPYEAINTLSYLKFKKHPIFNEFLQEKGSVERFFDQYLPFLTVQFGDFEPTFWKFRVLLTDLMVSSLLKSMNSILLVDSFITSINNRMLKLIADSPTSVACDFARTMVQFYKGTISRLKPEIATKRLVAFLNAIPPESPARPIVVRFLFRFSNKFIPIKQLALTLITQGVASTWDIELLYYLGNLMDLEATLIIIQYLTKLMHISWLWSRHAAVMLSHLINPTKIFPEIEDWFSQYIRQLYIFYELAEKKGKYKSRIARIKEIFNSPLFTNISFINDVIEDIDTSSPEFISEYEKFKSEFPDLKYFPFTSTGIDLYGIDTQEPPKKKRGKKKKATDTSASKRSASEPPENMKPRGKPKKKRGLPDRLIKKERATDDSELEKKFEPE